jgi:tetratricopeptide (TPR) repeat protein
MKTEEKTGRAGQTPQPEPRDPRNSVWFLILSLALACTTPSSSAETQQFTNRTASVTFTNGTVHYLAQNRAPAPAMLEQLLDFGDALRTLELSRAAVEFSDYSGLSIKDQTRLQILARSDLTNAPTIVLLEGEVYFSNRGSGPRRIPFIAQDVKGVPEGTEFLLRVRGGVTEVVMFDGAVELINSQGRARVSSGQHATATVGQPIRVESRIEAHNVVQWWIYYPAIVPVEELGLDEAERRRVAVSLTNYVSGDLIRAMESYPGYPAPDSPDTDAGKVYLAQIYLGVGAVDRAENLLKTVQQDHGGQALALNQLIRAVTPTLPYSPTTEQTVPGMHTKPGPWHSLSEEEVSSLYAHTNVPATAGGWLAQSFSLQALRDLAGARHSAQMATELAVGFGFAWARLAELQFSFGMRKEAKIAVDRALSLTPRNAQALTVRGFLQAAEHQTREAMASFSEAASIDPSLANAWLGKGLAMLMEESPLLFSVQSERRERWRESLSRAAILEPRRSLLRSYLGKMFADAGDFYRAEKELEYAKLLDPGDPTPWLYSALMRQQQNQSREAIRDLEHSVDLNDNRAVYRSRLLLDQDNAVRSANLARMYDQVGLGDISLREAAKAVSYDYTSFSSHQFLADSLNTRRDPNRFNLRDETVWFNEYLLASLLSPVGAGPTSQNVSQQDYARLFDRDRIGLASSTDYFSNGRWRETASQFGQMGRSSYAFDVEHYSQGDSNQNQDAHRTEWWSQIKHEVSPRDTLMILTKVQNSTSGDNRRYYAPLDRDLDTRYHEEQSPLAVAGWHRTWNPGSHTLLLAGRLESKVDQNDLNRRITIIDSDQSAGPYLINSSVSKATYSGSYELFLGEIQHILSGDWGDTVLGSRLQQGTMDFSSRLVTGTNVLLANLVNQTELATQASQNYQKLSGYVYVQPRLNRNLQLTLGSSVESVHSPLAHYTIPVDDAAIETVRLLPKAGLLWSRYPWLTLRTLYAETMGGLSFDESFRLEPSQLLGFPQSFRTLIPETEEGIVGLPHHRTTAVALDFKVGNSVFLGVGLQELKANVDRARGIIRYPVGPTDFHHADSSLGSARYRERELWASVHCLLGPWLSMATKYRYVDSKLRQNYEENLMQANFGSRHQARLHELRTSASVHHETGGFASIEHRFLIQTSSGYTSINADESSSQLNAYVGWRLKNSRAEFTLGLLNLANQDYRLNPLTPFDDLSRHRTVHARFRFYF